MPSHNSVPATSTFRKRARRSISPAHERVRSVARLASAALDQLRFAETLRMLGVGGRDARIASIIARMPSSERKALRRLQDSSAAFEPLGPESGDSLNELYSAVETPRRYRERAVRSGARPLPGAVAFFDLTNAHLAGRPVRPFEAEARRPSVGNLGPACCRLPPARRTWQRLRAGRPRRRCRQARSSGRRRSETHLHAGISTEFAWLHERARFGAAARHARNAPPMPLSNACRSRDPASERPRRRSALVHLEP